MGNEQHKAEMQNATALQVAAGFNSESESQIQKILKSDKKDAETMTVEKSKKNFRTIKKGKYEIYAQFDQETEQINGYGSVKENGKLLFEGEFIHSLRNGYGIEYQDGQVVYEGTYVNDLRDGWGKMKGYQGEFCRGKKSGWGVENNVTGKYEGYWKDDKYEGMGIKSYNYTLINNLYQLINKEANGNSSSNGTGNTQFPCDMYIGQWKNGLRDGLGKYKSKKETYQGEFSNDLYHGQGSLFSNNETKKGIFHKGQYKKQI